MKTFAEYYRDLLNWESVEFRELVTQWDRNLIEKVKKDFQIAVEESGLKKAVCEIRPKSLPQSIGNQVEVFAVEKLNSGLRVFNIEKCSGAGYPDRVLTEGDYKHIALEMKATSKWNDADTNRCVLTSSSIKLRRKFISPIYHLLCTVKYETQENCVEIQAVRLDFIEPDTNVNVRLEASVNQKILSSGNHESIII